MGASASKIKFKESLTSLTTKDISPTDTEFWDELWKIPSSSEEVFELLTPSNARLLRDEKFDNLATLFTQATAQLCQIVETPYTIYFDQALNCVRVLTRIVPFLLEKGGNDDELGESDPNVEMLCWGGSGVEDRDLDENENDIEEEAPTSIDEDANKSTSLEETVDGKGDNEQEQEPQIPSDIIENDKEKDESKREDDISSSINAGYELYESGSEKDESITTITDTNQVEVEDEEEVVEGEDMEDDNEPLALLVVHAAMHMLFLPQFTCEFYEEDDTYDDQSDDEQSDEEEDQRENGKDIETKADAKLINKPRRIRKGIRLTPRPVGIVWAPGVGFTVDGICHVGSRVDTAINGQKKSKQFASVQPSMKLNPEAAYTRKYDKNRIEVLRLLLATCSDPLFTSADEYDPLASRWMAVAVAADSPNAPCLFYSLLNTVISYDPRNASFGGMAASQFTDTHMQLVELSAQVLCVLLDCGSTGDPTPFENNRGEPVVKSSEADKVGFNIFRTLLARIDNGKDLSTLYRGFVRLLRNMFESKSKLLPTSQSRMECHQELLILLWKTL